MKKMTMTKLFTLSALALIGVTISSCGDDDEDVKVDPVIDRMEFLTNNSSKEWLFDSQIDYEGEIKSEECSKDNVWTFYSKGELLVDVQQVLCYEKEANSERDWSLNEDADEIIISIPGGESYLFRIIELSQQNLTLGFDVYEDEAREIYLGEDKVVLKAK